VVPVRSKVLNDIDELLLFSEQLSASSVNERHEICTQLREKHQQDAVQEDEQLRYVFAMFWDEKCANPAQIKARIGRILNLRKTASDDSSARLLLLLQHMLDRQVLLHASLHRKKREFSRIKSKFKSVQNQVIKSRGREMELQSKIDALRNIEDSLNQRK